jgi:hypothetical protein
MAREKCRVRERHEALFELCDALLLENNGRDSQQKRSNKEYPRKNFILFLCEQLPPPTQYYLMQVSIAFRAILIIKPQPNMPKFFVPWATDFSFYYFFFYKIGSVPSSFV